VKFKHKEILLWVFVSMRISIPQEGERTKVVGEEMQDALFKSWIQCNPRE